MNNNGVHENKTDHISSNQLRIDGYVELNYSHQYCTNVCNTQSELSEEISDKKICAVS